MKKLLPILGLFLLVLNVNLHADFLLASGGTAPKKYEAGDPLKFDPPEKLRIQGDALSFNADQTVIIVNQDGCYDININLNGDSPATRGLQVRVNRNGNKVLVDLHRCCGQSPKGPNALRLRSGDRLRFFSKNPINVSSFYIYVTNIDPSFCKLN